MKKDYQSIILTIFALASFAISVVFGFIGNKIQMSIMLVFFLSFLVFSNINKFKYFKINREGLEAKMKELDDSLHISQEIAVMLASTELSTLSRSGRWGGISNSEKEIIKDDLLEKLRFIGINEIVIKKEVLHHWIEYTLLDYYLAIYNGLYGFLKNNMKMKDIFNTFQIEFKINENDYLGDKKIKQGD